MLPKYLVAKLAIIGIEKPDQITKYNYLQVFQWLKCDHKSLSFKTLFDLYCLAHKHPLNSLAPDLQQTLIFEYNNLLPSYPPLTLATIQKYLNEALTQAAFASSKNEIPIGAVIVKDDKIIAKGYNQTLTQGNILYHAEIVALQNAQNTLNNHRLNDCDLYVTIEPCLMCVGAILHSRIRRVIFGAVEPKTGAICSQYTALHNQIVNHQTEAIGPINSEYYNKALKKFLRAKR